LYTIKMWHSTYFPDVCVSVIFRAALVISRDHNTYCQNGGETEYNSCHRDARAIWRIWHLLAKWRL
jgi:hypothetical protein